MGDATITAGSDSVPLSDIFTYTIPNLMSVTGNTDEGYRSPSGGGDLGPMTGPPCALNYQGNDCARTACGTEMFIDVRGTYNGSGRRRRLCADIKPSEECTTAMASWDPCADAYWSTQCQLSCNLCTNDDSGNSGDDSSDNTDSGNSDVATGCESYAYTFDSGSLALSVAAVVFSLFVFV